MSIFRSAGLAGLVAVTLVKLAAQPVAVGQPATIVFAPWIGTADAIARASVGARLLTVRGAAWGGAALGVTVTVVPDRADYAAADGAWFVTGLAVPAGCAFRDAAPGPARS